MPLEKDTEEHFLVNYSAGNELTLYWNRDGQVLYRGHPIRGADPSSFHFYLGSFAKDRRNCYCTSSRLVGADPTSFHAMNYAFAKDQSNVWTLGGKVRDADAASFMVCDDGFYFPTPHCRAPHGFAKDNARVFYEDTHGKAKWVRKADPKTFISLNDGHFAKDENHIFFGATALPKAIVERWRKIGGLYSSDGVHVYYCERLLRDADIETFKVISAPHDTQLAKDKNRYYWNDSVIDAAKFLGLSAEVAPL
jgi:hypothetical protein